MSKAKERLIATNIKKYGSYEAYRKEMSRRARLGGKKSRKGGFYKNQELAREAGRLGGIAKALNKLKEVP